jgi:hypothetical protein
MLLERAFLGDGDEHGGGDCANGGRVTRCTIKRRRFLHKRILLMTASALDDLNSLIHHVTNSYAGFQEKTRDRLPQLEALSDAARRRMPHAPSLEEQTALLREWLSFFDDPHMRLVCRSERNAHKELIKNDKREELQITSVDSDTLMLRIPTCALSLVEPMNKLLAAHEETLAANRFLIIDLRRNGGGTDYIFFGLIPLLYTNPITRIGADFWASRENTAYLRAGVDSCGLPEEVRNAYDRVLDRMEANPDSMVPGLPDQTIVFGEVLPRPERIGILTDKVCASATEEFLLLAKQSKKVLLIGENTAGCLDYANQRDIDLPTGQHMLRLPMSRSRRLPDNPIDRTGIVPDVRLPDAEIDAVTFARSYLSGLTAQSDTME